MIANIIYVLIAVILLFVLYLAVQAITRGVEAKGDLKSEKEIEEISNSKNRDTKDNIYDEITKINKLYSEGVINEEEFKKAKEKILK